MIAAVTIQTDIRTLFRPLTRVPRCRRRDRYGENFARSGFVIRRRSGGTHDGEARYHVVVVVNRVIAGNVADVGTNAVHSPISGGVQMVIPPTATAAAAAPVQMNVL